MAPHILANLRQFGGRQWRNRPGKAVVRKICTFMGKSCGAERQTMRRLGVPPKAGRDMSATHPARISLKLRELNQLFNSMDPSPFLDRDLDDDAEEFIVSSARELHGSHAFELVVHLGTVPEPERANATEHAVQHYFAARAELKKREFRLLLRRGHSVLAIGLLFLASCLGLSGLVTKLLPNPLGQILHEGLMIVGWVAMWRPLETYLYDWWPLRQEWIRLRRLAHMRVRLVSPSARPIDSVANASSHPGTVNTETAVNSAGESR